MKNITSLKSNDTNSPKTPGGISKSLLTPCRRLGLSRNWRKSGPSPFVSPLASASADVAEEKNESRKRKERLSDENIELTDNNTKNKISTKNIAHTPSRNVEAPRKKKSKTLLTVINESKEQELNSEECNDELTLPETQSADNHTAEPEVVSTPVRTKSKKSKNHVSLLKTSTNETRMDSRSEEPHASPAIIDKNNAEEALFTIKEKSPNDLSRECVVVIQRKMFKNTDSNDNGTNCKLIKDKKPSETLDSDSDEAPLINIQKQYSMESNTTVIKDEDDDFIDNKTSNTKSNKVKNSKSPKNKQKTTKPAKSKAEKTPNVKPSQSCLDDDDDDFDNKKTILIKKTYEKVLKPVKAKSTGSITQRDIDNLRDRIEAKKKLLLAQSLTPDTEELRGLIKKWQKGCQVALMELLDLMRNKFSDKATMDYSEMLRTLKIPPSLVGYDSENDCFNSPDDASIILGQFKEI